MELKICVVYAGASVALFTYKTTLFFFVSKGMCNVPYFNNLPILDLENFVSVSDPRQIVVAIDN